MVAVVVAGLGLAVALVLLGTQVRAFVTDGIGGGDERIDLEPLATRSVVHARDGSVLSVLHAEENRVPVPLDRVPPHVVQAVLDAEDERFWEHGALDLRSITRALVTNVEEGGVLEGGSTITQQLVKTSLLDPEKSLSRKVEEAILAVRLESQMPKREILERYLNTVYFGNGAYGVQAAAERYFSTNVEQLTLAQAVMLAGLIRNPGRADPFVVPQAARERRAVVVDRMRLLGHVSPAEAEQVKAEALPAKPPDLPAQSSDYFSEKVKQELLADTRLGATAQDRFQAVFKGGLAIHTTLDPNYQRLAQEKVASILPDTDGRFNAAVVSVEPSTGAVRSLVGGADFDTVKFNLVTDGPGRQTGSSFKVFTLVAALENGFLPTDTISGSVPCPIPNPGGSPDPWPPENFEGQGGGMLSLTEATVNSVNCAYARLVKLVGPEKVVEAAKRMGITNELAPHLSITLGGQGVTPLQMASAFATLAADGERHEPYFVESVQDRSGRVVLEADRTPQRAISEQHARLVNQILTQVVARGTGRAASVPRWTPAGKTGTTDVHGDAWFVGYTPTLSTAVWMGNPEAVVPMLNVGGIRVAGGTYPARIWGAYMREVLKGQAPVAFPAPDGALPRAPKTLLLPGERPPVVPRRETVARPVTPAPARPVTPQPVVPVTPTPTIIIVQPPVVVDDGRQERTPRTARPPRPRDLATIPQ